MQRADDRAGCASLRMTGVQAFHAWCLSACVFCQRWLPGLRPRLAWHLSSPLMVYGIFLAPGLPRPPAAAEAWHMPLPAVIFSFDVLLSLAAFVRFD